MYNDPILKYRPFPEIPKSYYEAHWHEIAISFIFYESLYHLSTLFSPRFINIYSKLSPRTKINFDIHIVSTIQSLAVLILSLPIFKDDHFANESDRLFAYTPYAGMVASLTAGYFIWDCYICIKYYRMFGFGFLFHGFAALFVFFQALQPFLLHYLPHFLLFELSTPFVNLNWFASHLPADAIPNLIIIINGLLLMVIFFIVRVIWGWWSIYRVVRDFVLYYEENAERFPVKISIVIVLLNIGLNSLNLYWFSKMIKIAIKKAKSTAKSTKNENEAIPIDNSKVDGGAEVEKKIANVIEETINDIDTELIKESGGETNNNPTKLD